VDLLQDLATEAGPDRQAVVARELTKLHEEIRSGTLAELVKYFEAEEPRGEITLILAGARPPAVDRVSPAEFDSRVHQLLAQGLTRKGVVQRLVEETGMARNEVYRRVMDLPS
jgi:16S rRNA (cytidine1402-2'-O)-methyltransferase